MSDDFRTHSDADEYLKHRSQRVAELNTRMAALENRSGALRGLYKTVINELEKTEQSIGFLESRALRPEDRPARQEKDLVSRLTVEDEHRQNEAQKIRGLDELEARCETLDQEFTKLLARVDTAKREMGAAMARVELLEEKCLLPSERPAMPLHLRNVPGGVDRPTHHKF
jgi:chromosome segregation ATPase